MGLRQTSGSVLCPSCGLLVGVRDTTCANCGRRNPGMFGFAHLLRGFGRDLGMVSLITAVCIGVYLFGLAVDPGGIRSGGLFSLLSPSNGALFLFGASGSVPVFEAGRWWTLLSAGWIHAGLLHLAFNLMWVRQLAPAVAEIYGPGRTSILYVVSSVCGFALTTGVSHYLPFLPRIFAGASFTVGASAATFGLLGALVLAGRRGAGRMIGQQAWTWALVMFVFGFAVGGGVDNYAHLGGFLGGYVGGRVLDPYKPDRGDHILIGLLLLAASLVSIVVSFLHGRAFLGG